jgi:tetratricopeptide (TPR) repeat protein
LLTFLEQPDWNPGFHALKLEENEMRQVIGAKYEKALAALEKAEARWTALFPSDLGPPDLNFLIDIPAMKDRALNLFQVERYSEAMDLMEKAAQTYDQWTDEVLAARERARPVWERSSKRIEAMGMRFVFVNGIYWSVWELRWMDFARWLADNREIEHLIMSQMDVDPKRIGPTYPVTGLDRRTAKSLAVWFGYNMEQLARPVSALPTRQHWEELWETEGLKEDYQFGLAPEENPDRVLVLRDYYLDKGIQPESHLKPVGMGVASPHGLFDLQGNAWEWSASDLVLKREESHNQETLKWMLHGGGYFGQHRYSSFEPPRDNAVFITRPEAIGLRIILQTNPTLDKAAQ